MAATSSAFRTEARDEHLYNHIELFNRSSSTIDAPAANRCQNCRGQHPTENQIATGRRMFGDYRTEPSNGHLYYNIQSINKPSSPSTESQGANQTSQDDRRRQQPTGNSKTMGQRVASAMIAVLALAFLAMLASLIATKWVHAEKSGTKNGNFLDRYKMTFSNRRRPKVRNRSRALAWSRVTSSNLTDFWYILLKWCPKYCIDSFRWGFSLLWKILRSPWGAAIGGWKSSLEIEEINSLSLYSVKGSFRWVKASKIRNYVFRSIISTII